MKQFCGFGLMLVLVGCSASEPPGDHAADDDLLQEVGEAVTCGPSLQRYPVAGPHNGGYDANALNYTCPAHPGSSPDNSDYIGGSHYGNDIFGPKGTPIVAPVNGTIVKAGWNTVGGNRVTVQDGCGWSYYHAHLTTIAVSEGQKVSAGQVIGTLGNTGSASGTSPHLHFSIYPGVYEQGIDPFPHLQAVDHTSCPQQCKPHCEGSKIVSADCGVGDCGVYGATCVDDAKGVRCASVFCPAVGQTKVCVNDKLIGDCNDGAISTGDCSVYGAGCVSDAKGARCVVVFCLDKPTVAHDVCLPDGQLAHCNDLGGITTEKCPASAPCTQGGGSAQCGAPKPSPGGGGASGASGSAGAAGDDGSGGASGASGGSGGSGGKAGGAGAASGGSGAISPKSGTTELDEGCSVTGPGQRRSSEGWLVLAGLLAAVRRRDRGGAPGVGAAHG